VRFDRRFLIVVGCSLLWAFLVTSLFYRVASNSAHPHGVSGGRPLVVASQPLPFGARIGPETVKIIQVPETLFPKGGYSRPEDVIDRSVVSAIEQDEPVVEVRIAPRGSGVGMAPMIPPGLRAIAVRVNDVVGVAGFVLPGMRVDILVTGHPPASNETVTTTVLQNIPVLSAGQTMQADNKGQPISATVVTLLVNPAEAEALTLANSEGHIQLVLRNNTDRQVIRTPGSQTRELYAVGGRVMAAPAPDPAPVRSRPAVVASPVRTVAPVVIPVPVSSPPPVVTMPAPRSEEVIMIRGNQKTIEAAPSRMDH